VELDELAEAFRHKAVVDRDVASGVLLTKIHERRATLLGLNAPAAAAVHIIEHQRPTLRPPTDRVEAAINRIRDQRLPAPALECAPDVPCAAHASQGLTVLRIARQIVP